jgi:alpha-tubulin suppressor-like RCC1 family protein
VHAWVGDGADYYIDPAGGLFVRGKAHRGQYGDGRLAESPGWTRVAGDAVAVVAHTGHALYLRRDGAVLGTGGNRFGPLGRHGLGDKADTWGVIFSAASQIATGSRHSLAIRADGMLWIWGAGAGLEPAPVLSNVVAAGGGLEDSVALTADGAVWNWGLGQAPARVELPRQ